MLSTHANIHTYRHHGALAVATNFSSINISGLAKLAEITILTSHEENWLCGISMCCVPTLLYRIVGFF